MIRRHVCEDNDRMPKYRIPGYLQAGLGECLYCKKKVSITNILEDYFLSVEEMLEKGDKLT